MFFNIMNIGIEIHRSIDIPDVAYDFCQIGRLHMSTSKLLSICM